MTAGMDKKDIAAVLDEMGTLLELQGANPFKARAFHNASRSVEGITDDLPELVRSGALLKIAGIGKGTAQVIGDLVATGLSKDHQELRKAFPPGVLDMLRIQGLGPKKVKVLYDTLKLSGLEALEKAANDGRLEKLDGFGKKTAENILKGIEALRSRSDKRLYPVAEAAALPLLAALRKRKEVIRAEIAGSLRRRREVVGDIDIVVSARDRDREALMAFFTGLPEVQSVAARGDTKSSVVLRSGIACDLRVVSDAEFPFALNYFTGSKEHNVALRSRARQRGWSLNEYGFSAIDEEALPAKTRKGLRCKDEAELYGALDLTFIPPELREDMGEIEAAAQGTLPQLVEWTDIRGTFHCHTTYSDGLHTLPQMVRAARDLGWEYLGIADHSKAAAYAGGLSEERLREQWKEIDALNAREPKFRVFKGTECDILAGGELDWPDAILAECDYVVASVHSNFSLSQAAMTRRIITAIRNRHVTMLGHPTGRLLLAREPYAVDMPQVIQAAADYGKVIEINAHPSRLDLDWRLCRLARDRGVMIAINPDAHTVDGLNDVRFGVGVARKGWLERVHILNAQRCSSVMEYLQIS
jgi:DNA polymerase (family X)